MAKADATARRVGLYCRVSTDGQTVANQLQELTGVCERRGWTVAARAGRSGRR